MTVAKRTKSESKVLESNSFLITRVDPAHVPLPHRRFPA